MCFLTRCITPPSMFLNFLRNSPLNVGLFLQTVHYCLRIRRLKEILKGQGKIFVKNDDGNEVLL